jgi:hypothetical protein
MQTRTEKRRVFQGSVRHTIAPFYESNHKDDKEARAKSKKHLKAYLRGDKYYYYKTDKDGQPMRYSVQESFVDRECQVPRNKSRR